MCKINFRYSYIWAIIFPVAVIFNAVVLNSCTSRQPEEVFKYIEEKNIKPSGVKIEYPLDGTIFPPEIPSPGFRWKGSSVKTEQWYVRLSAKDGKVLYAGLTKNPEWKPDSAMWSDIKTTHRNEQISFTVACRGGGDNGSRYSTGNISFSLSPDSVGATVFYRAVPLPFSYAVKNVNEIEWYTGNVAGGKPRRVLNNIPVCANCHSFSRNGTLAMDVDYANDKGSYIIVPLKDTVSLSIDKIISWSDYRREDGELTYGLLSQISPDGRYVLSTVKDRSVFVAIDNLEYSQLFFPIKGIVAVYDRNLKKYYELQGASDKRFVQSNPNWSPDGTEVLFTRTERYMTPRIEKSQNVILNLEDVKEFTTRQKDFKFNVYRVPFNNGKGGVAFPVTGASGNNMSNFFARYSPDGKWIVFCQAKDFMLLQADSKLYIMPASGGTPHLMKCNTDNMNSWHSWSPNSKWIVFSSKKGGPYTQLYITHIDENGNDSPAVLLENMSFEKRAANIPEFFDNKNFGLTTMLDDFSDNAMYYNRLASLNIKKSEYKDALANLEKAIKKDSTYYEAYKNRYYLNIILGRSNSKEDIHDKLMAKRFIDKLISQNPSDRSLLLKRAEMSLSMENYEAALTDAQNILRTDVSNFNACELTASVYQRKGDLSKAIPYLKKMQEIQPDNIQVQYSLSILYKNINQVQEAFKIINSLIDKNQGESGFYLTRASLFLMEGNTDSALSDYDKAVSCDPENYIVYRERGLFYIHNSYRDKALNDFNKAVYLINDKIAKNPQDNRLLIDRAELKEQSGDIQGALTEYENYLKIWPLNSSVLKKTGQIYYSSKQWQKAIGAYTVLLDNFTPESRTFLNRGLAYQQSGDLSSALSDINSAVQTEPEGYPYYYFRSVLKNNMHDPAGARNDLKTAEELLKLQQSRRKLDRTEQNMLSAIEKQLGKN